MQPKHWGKLFLTIACLSFYLNCLGQTIPTSSSELSQVPTMLYPNELSIGGQQWNNWFAKNETEIFYTIFQDGKSCIVRRTISTSTLGPIKKLPFDDSYNYSHPWVNEEGNHMIFQASIPHPTNGGTDFSIWQSFLSNKGWSQPKLFADATASPDNEGSPVLSKSGNLYFNLTKENDGEADLFVLKKGDRSPTKLPNTINTEQFEGDFFIDREERYIIFTSFEREKTQGQSDLYISFKTEDTWSAAVWLGSKINSTQQDISPYVTNDGKRLIFTSNRLSQHSLRPSFDHFIVDFNIDEFRELVK